LWEIVAVAPLVSAAPIIRIRSHKGYKAIVNSVGQEWVRGAARKPGWPTPRVDADLAVPSSTRIEEGDDLSVSAIS